MNRPGRVYLSFDFEECDLPREQGVDFSLAEGMRYSAEGARAVLDLLDREGVKATFFTTLNFAERAPEIVRRLVAAGHELAAHGVDHFRPAADDPEKCRAGLRRLFPDVEVVGYRQPRMFPVADAALAAAGYRYDSSLNPACVPGRYCHLSVPRRPFVRAGILRIPASVTPILRFPLFWLSLHLLPERLYHALARRTLRHDGRLVVYFHPWEFSSLGERACELHLPRLVRPHLGPAMVRRLGRFIGAMRKNGAEFDIISHMSLEG